RGDPGQGPRHGSRPEHFAAGRRARGGPHHRSSSGPRRAFAPLMPPGAGAPRFAWVDGALVPRGEARVSIDDFGARYGAACFETMLARTGRVFRLDAHLE